MKDDRGDPSARRLLRRAPGTWAALCLLAGAACAHASGSLIPDWSHLPIDPYPLWSATPDNPVITTADVTDAPAYLVADPFLFREDDTWYMFFEVYSTTHGHGVIALATSADGLQWTYQQIVLAELWHVSYPYVFKVDDEYYMVLESSSHEDVRLYRARDFPRSWVYDATLLSGRPYADPAIFRCDNTWWMFVSRSSSDMCYLFYSDSLRSGWTEHPMSPVVVNDRSQARPAGRGIVLAGDHVIRLAQMGAVVYGQGVRAFRVDCLDRTHYLEHEVPESPILFASGQGWNAEGMHTCDPWWVGDHWIAAVDGRSSETWSIGIYRTPTVASGVDPRTDLPATTLVLGPSEPNPFGDRTRIPFEILGSAPPDPVEATIYDSAGRFVIRLAAGTRPPGRYVAEWAGEDYLGRAAANGSYLVLVRQGDASATRRICLIR